GVSTPLPPASSGWSSAFLPPELLHPATANASARAKVAAANVALLRAMEGHLPFVGRCLGLRSCSVLYAGTRRHVNSLLSHQYVFRVLRANQKREFKRVT